MDSKSCYEAAYGAFIDLVDLNGKATEQERQEAEEALLDFNENVPGFKEQATKAYKDIMEEIVEKSSNKEKKCINSFQELNRVGVKMGIAEELSNDRIIDIIKDIKKNERNASTSPNRQTSANRQFKYNPNIVDEFDEVSTSSGKNKKSGCCSNQSRCCLLI